MRASNFFMQVSTITQSGNLTTFSSASYDSSITNRDTSVSLATMKQDLADNDPYGNVNIFVSSKNLTDGSISVTYEKSSFSEETTDSIDILNFSARG